MGLLIGGVLAAPFGAMLAKRVPAKTLMVSMILTITSLFGLHRAIWH